MTGSASRALAVAVTVALSLGLAQAQEPPVLPPPQAEAPAVPPETGPSLPPPEATVFPNPPVPPRGEDPAAPGLFGGPGGFGGGRGGGMGGPGYAVVGYPSRPVSGQATDLALVRQNLSLAAPLWRDGADGLTLLAGVRNSLFVTDAVLPDTHRPFPGELWNVNLGLNYIHRFDNGWTGGLTTTFGSASDEPFHSLRELTGSVSAFLRVPAHNDRDAWLFSVMYSPVANLNFPIPGVAYVWNPSPDLRVTIGLPLAILWRPVEDLTLNLSYVPLTNINALATYRVAERFHLYGGYEFLNESYFLADRENAQDRFMGFEQRLIGGVRWDVWRRAALDLNGGYAFDRHYGEGRNQGSSLHDRVDIAPGAFFGAGLRFRY